MSGSYVFAFKMEVVVPFVSKILSREIEAGSLEQDPGAEVCFEPSYSGFPSEIVFFFRALGDHAFDNAAVRKC